MTTSHPSDSTQVGDPPRLAETPSAVKMVTVGDSTRSTDIEELEQYGRRNALRFLRVPLEDIPSETSGGRVTYHTDEFIVDFVNNKMDLPLELSEISRSHIVGKIDRDNNRCGIIVKFITYNVRHRVFCGKRNLKSKGSNIHIVEDLTTERFTTMKHLGKLFKAKKVCSYWSSDGRIFFKCSEHDTAHRVKYPDDLREHFDGDLDVVDQSTSQPDNQSTT